LTTSEVRFSYQTSPHVEGSGILGLGWFRPCDSAKGIWSAVMRKPF